MFMSNTQYNHGGIQGRPRVPILSFWHANLMKDGHIGSWRRAPYEKSWIRHFNMERYEGVL